MYYSYQKDQDTNNNNNNDCVLVSLIAVSGLNCKVRPKACEGASGSHYMVHTWPWSTAPQPIGCSCESILRREENQSAWKKILIVRLRSTNNSPHICPRQESNLGHSGGRCECYSTIQKYFNMVTGWSHWLIP